MISNDRHPLYDDAAALFRANNRVSTSFLQRTVGIGYNEAARIVEQLERDGVISKPNTVGKRELIEAPHPRPGHPVSGYTLQSDAAVEQVNLHKQMEERLLRVLDELKEFKDVDQRWLAIGRSSIEQGFMAVNRAVFRPQRLDLPEEDV